MRRTAVVLLLVLGAFASVASVGFHISDEATLGAAARSLYAGRLEVREFPPEYYSPYGWKEQHEVVLAHPYVTETRGGAAISYPAFLLLEGWSHVAPVPLLLALVAIAPLAAALTLWRRPAWRAQAPGRRRAEATAIAATTLLVTGASASKLGTLDPLWHAPLAMQLTTLLVFATGIALLDRLVAHRHGTRVASWTTTILCAGTSVAFWAFGQKYHGMQVGLVGIVLALRYLPGSGHRAHALAYGAAGLAVWIHPRTGGLLLLALLGIDLARALPRWRAWRTLAWPALVCGAALALGLTGFAIENTLLYDAPHVTGYALTAHVPTPAGSANDSAPVAPTVHYEAAPPAQTAERAFQGIASGDGTASWWTAVWLGPRLLVPGIDVQFGILMVAPLVALAPLGVALRRRAFDGLDATLLLHVALVIGAYGPQAAAPGVGALDSRYMQVLLPALALYAGIAVARTTQATGWRVALATLAALVVLIGALALAQADFTERVRVIRALGLAMAAALAAWALVRPRLARTISILDTPIVSLGLAASALFLASFLIHTPPRAIPVEGGSIHFLPIADDLRRILTRIWP